MICPNCGSENLYVKDTRSHDRYVFRKRLCVDCRYYFATCEVAMDDITDDILKGVGVEEGEKRRAGRTGF